MLSCLMIALTIVLWFWMGLLIYPLLADWAAGANKILDHIEDASVSDLLKNLLVAIATVIFAVPMTFAECTRKK